MSWPVPYLLSMSIFALLTSTIFTVSACVSLYHICPPWNIFGSQPGLTLQYHRGLACTIFPFHQYVFHPWPVSPVLPFGGLYHICLPCIVFGPRPVLYLQHYHLSACTTFASHEYFWNQPKLYPQYYHVLACSTFASCIFCFPSWNYAYSIATSQPVPYLLLLCIYCISICQSVPHLLPLIICCSWCASKWGKRLKTSPCCHFYAW